MAPRQLSLIDYIERSRVPAPTSRRRDPVTSRMAGDRAPKLRAGDRAEVLRLHAANPDGLTDFELAALMQRQQTSVGKRRVELRDSGLIAQTEMRRPSPSGSPAIVWRITDEGLRATNQAKE